MGQLASKEKKEARKRDKEIKQQMQSQRNWRDREFRLLLLGAGESGKSTFLKQMEIIHAQGFSEDRRHELRKTILYSLVMNSQEIIAAAERFEISIDGDAKNVADKLVEVHSEDLVLGSVGLEVLPTAEEFTTFWKSESVQATFARRSEFQLEDSYEYFMTEVARVLSPSFVPNDEDVLRARVKTTGIAEVKLKVDNHPLTWIDVGGQKNERRKWMGMFEDVTAILYFVGLSDFDQMMREDNSKNRMTDSLELFSAIVNKYLQNPFVIVFLNKKDLLETKVRNGSKVSQHFPDYKGDDTDVEEIVKFFGGKFASVVTNPDQRQLSVHATCATDTKQIETVFETVRTQIMAASMNSVF